MRVLKALLILGIAIAIALCLCYFLGWLLSIIINPVLRHFGIKTLTPFIAFLIVVAINILLGVIRM